MRHFVDIESFDQWRSEARRLVAAGVEPASVFWTNQRRQPFLFESTELPVTPETQNRSFTVPPSFLELARTVACHRDPIRWELLYRVLWRLTHGEPKLLEIVSDDDIHALAQMRKAVTRDVHKMKAFVRFRKVVSPSGEENYIAWHRPDHRIVRLAAPFFSRRFKAMNWSIMTPEESVCWDQHKLRYGNGIPVSEAPDEDALEDLWRTYYASIFNPARVKLGMMKREMPVRHWPTLPEATIIDELLKQAPARVNAMIQRTEGFHQTATHFMPDRLDLPALREAASGCRACPLHGPATQTVFGQGPANARVVIVGEQPGDREDLAGKPFVGPAGQILTDALREAGIDRDDVYITNVVKHFKFVESVSPPSAPRSKSRLHKKPDSREIFACRPWLEAELATIRPEALVCLGATAAQALFGRDFRISKSRGRSLPTEWCSQTIATWHPAAILRMPDQSRRQEMREQLVSDLRVTCGGTRQNSDHDL